MAEIYYSEKNNYLYTGKMKDGDRLANEKEIAYWQKYHSTIGKDKELKNAENTTEYAKALQKPLICGEYIVIAEWINTYTNTYTYAKKQEDANATASADIVAFTKAGKMVTVTINSLADFEPFYNVVAEEWARITDIRNKYMVEIQNSEAPKEIEIKY